MQASMSVLLDTHTFLWTISDDPRLGPLCRELIQFQAPRVLLSHASLWEISIKHGREGGGMPLSTAQAIQWCEASGFELPQHHNDPFDRLLVAQSVSDSIMVLTPKPMVRAYGCLQLNAHR